MSESPSRSDPRAEVANNGTLQTHGDVPVDFRRVRFDDESEFVDLHDPERPSPSFYVFGFRPYTAYRCQRSSLRLFLRINLEVTQGTLRNYK